MRADPNAIPSPEIRRMLADYLGKASSRLLLVALACETGDMNQITLQLLAISNHIENADQYIDLIIAKEKI